MECLAAEFYSFLLETHLTSTSLDLCALQNAKVHLSPRNLYFCVDFEEHGNNTLR